MNNQNIEQQPNKNNPGGITTLIFILAVILIAIIVIVVLNKHNSSSNSSALNTKSSSSQSNTYNDPEKVYTITYPQNWTIKEQSISGLSSLPTLDKTRAVLTPDNLPAEAKGNAYVTVSSFKTSDLNTFLTKTAKPNNIDINGYKAIYFQDVASPSNTGAIGYTDDYYVVTHNNATLVFYFREKQNTNSSKTSYSVTNEVPGYTSVVKSVKFTN